MLIILQRAAFVRSQLEEQDMPVADAPDDDDVRQTYNFAPGNHGLVYRADVPDYGGGARPYDDGSAPDADGNDRQASTDRTQSDVPGVTRYKLQSMKWGLVPFWTKRNPEYSSMLRTINARDDSLASKGGMWNTMKQRKRCIVVAQGFYEWLKKNGGKEKIPYFTKRKDQRLMCFAGLWDCVKYDGSDEKHYTYTIITTDSNKQLSFLHDRMPVILENGSHEIRTWLDPARSEWTKELQSLLKPYKGELECYPVNKDVGKVGNNSPSFIVPITSSENKNNIANFFGNAKKQAKGFQTKQEVGKEEQKTLDKGTAVNEIKQEDRATTDHDGKEDNAPMPVPSTEATKTGIKRQLEAEAEYGPEPKSIKLEDCDRPSTEARRSHSKSPRYRTSKLLKRNRRARKVGAPPVTGQEKVVPSSPMVPSRSPISSNEGPSLIMTLAGPPSKNAANG